MAITFSEAIGILQRRIGDRGASSRTDCGLFLNMAQREVCRARDWPELVTRDFVACTAPYKDGTVDVTAGDATVTGTATTFTSGMVGRKFALGYSSAWYEVLTFTSTTEIELADDYAESTDTGKTYVIYDDRVSMPADCDKIHRIWSIENNIRTPMRRLEGVDLHEVTGLPEYEDEPNFWAQIENDSNGYIRIQVGPYAPPSAIRLEVKYKKKPTDMVVTSQESWTLAEDRIPTAIQYATYWGVQRDERAAAREYSVYLEMLDRLWAQSGEGADVLPLGEVRQRRTDVRSIIDFRSLEGA